ncbi:MAG TPA: ABC transporter ATP-binding protein [Gemmatimonadota bacterium]|nr:ABC transporter ATP-binding protein [Gemmatimonadota bacterium]
MIDAADLASPPATLAAPPVLAIRGLRHEAGGRVILDIPTFEVPAGTMLAVLGPNGAGKSTLMRILAGLRVPTAGALEFRPADGQPVNGEAAAEALRRRSAFVFQAPYLWTGTVRRNLELGLRFRGLDDAEVDRRVDAIAAQLGLGAVLGRNAGELSGGEVQRVALARALVLDPEVLFLDEPSSNLDAEAHAALREDLDRVARARAGAIVLATHERPDAFYLADSIAVLRGGRLVQAGTPAELFENPTDSFIAGITGAELSMRGVVTAADGELLTVQVGGEELLAVGDAAPGDTIKLAYRPEDLYLSRRAPEGGSARNRFRARVTEVRSLGSLVRIRLAGPNELVAIVTRAAASELELTRDAEIWVQIKATALHGFEL